MLRKCVSVMDRTPRRWYMRRTARSSSIWWPPSIVRMAAIRPFFVMRSTSAAVRARAISSGCVSKSALHGVAQVERAADGLGAFVVGGDPKREERRVDAALFQPRNIDVADGRALRDVGAVDEDALRGVDVGVHADVLARRSVASNEQEQCGTHGQTIPQLVCCAHVEYRKPDSSRIPLDHRPSQRGWRREIHAIF